VYGKKTDVSRLQQVRTVAQVAGLSVEQSVDQTDFEQSMALPALGLHRRHSELSPPTNRAP
jgi:hypothetical protein